MEGAKEEETLKGAVEAIKANVIVMTQACDLEQAKVEQIILCPHLDIDEYKKLWEEKRTEDGVGIGGKAWKSEYNDITDGYVWHLAMLNNEMDLEVTMNHRIVDFHYIYSAPRTFLESLLEQRKKTRLRMMPPYREYVSQAFARYFMRIGLPKPISPIKQ